MTETGKSVNRNIRAEIARAGKLQAEVATGSGIGPTGFSKRLAGKISWTVDEVGEVAKALGVPVSVLLADVAPDTLTEDVTR